MSNILVTGGAGFVGSHLCEALVKQGHNVISYDNYSTGSYNNHVNGVIYKNGHTADIDSLESMDFSPEMIYHLGEYSRVEQSFDDFNKMYESNVVGTKAVLEYARRHDSKLIYAGSSTKFANNGADSSPYAWSKSANTRLVTNYGEWFGLNYAITYFYNVYGPREISEGEYATVVAKFMRLRKEGKPLPVTLPGNQERNFTHVNDIVSGLLLVGKSGIGDEYGIGSPEKFTVNQLAIMIGGAIDYMPEKRGNRQSAELKIDRTLKLGWFPKYSLEEYIKNFRATL